VPVPTTMPFVAVYAVPSTSTRPGPEIEPVPRTKVAPLPVSRSTATWSFQVSVASSRIRFATTDQSAVTWPTEPARPSTRRASASASAARTIIFDGMQPQ
jgi:hypothetical protein